MPEFFKQALVGYEFSTQNSMKNIKNIVEITRRGWLGLKQLYFKMNDLFNIPKMAKYIQIGGHNELDILTLCNRKSRD